VWIGGFTASLRSQHGFRRADQDFHHPDRWPRCDQTSFRLSNHKHRLVRERVVAGTSPATLEQPWSLGVPGRVLARPPKTPHRLFFSAVRARGPLSRRTHLYRG
jgi:hypothetical protein